MSDGTAGVRLVCPLCGTVVSDGPEPEPGACPRCGARYAGGAGDVPGAVAEALAHLGAAGLPPDALARRLFEIEPPDPRAERVAITSDRRTGFYRWWLFVQAEDDEARALLEGLLAP